MYQLKNKGIGSQVHYIPIHILQYKKKKDNNLLKAVKITILKLYLSLFIQN